MCHIELASLKAADDCTTTASVLALCRVMQTKVTLDFGRSVVTIRDTVHGARLIRGGDNTSTQAVFSLLADEQCKDASSIFKAPR